MKFTTGLIIGLLSVIAAVAEFVLYMIFSVALAMNEANTSVLASMAIFLIFLTLLAGIAAPVCGAIESLSERKNIGLKLFVPAMILAAIGLCGIVVVSRSMQPLIPASTSYTRGVVR